ncbi:MAG: AarF/UbiB family protein [Clostridiaceae bacterium]
MVYKKAKGNKNDAEARHSGRMQEILAVLKRHNIIHGVSPEKLRNILEDLGPTYVKIGQIMSMRSDMLPQSYCDELMKLRADVKPMTPEEVRQIVETELKHPIEELFINFSFTPLGSASIAQVHTAYLKNSRKVAVKVQRINIRETMKQDIVLMRRAAKLLNIINLTGDVIDFNAIIDELWATSQQEMDFQQEARHLKEFAELNRSIEYISCPTVDYNLVTSRVLVMEYVEGIPIDQVDKLTALGYDMNEIGINLAENYTKQILDDGFFHADPHPGNIWLRDGKIVWLDLGMVGKLSNYDRELFKSIVKSMVSHDVFELKSTLLTMGEVKERINHARLYTDIDDMLTKYGNMNLSNINLGKLLSEMQNLAKEHHIAMPSGISMLVRGLVTIEGVLSVCCPDVNFIQVVSGHLSKFAFADFDIKKELRHTGKSAYTFFKKSMDIPAQLSDILKMSIKGQTKLNMELSGADETLRDVRRMMDKLVISNISAALIIASSLICTTDMKPKIAGIPLIGFIGFVGAAVLGIWLVYGILTKRKN